MESNKQDKLEDVNSDTNKSTVEECSFITYFKLRAPSMIVFALGYI